MKKIYSFITYIYNYFFSIIENLLYKKVIHNNNFTEKGYFKFNDLRIVNYKFENSYQTIVNQYYKKIILSQKELENLISSIFVSNNLHKKISDITGFNYSIDFFTAYETSSIAAEDLNKGWYANHPHKDKPYSQNTIKLIIPLQDVSELDGPMKILNKTKSKNFNLNFNLINEFENVTFKIGEAFLFNPNICYHYASNPSNGRARKQMMFQLNPSKEWSINQKIFDYQNIREPKFPFFSYLFNSKKPLDLLIL